MNGDLWAPGVHSFTKQAELCYRGSYNPYLLVGQR